MGNSKTKDKNNVFSAMGMNKSNDNKLVVAVTATLHKNAEKIAESVVFSQSYGFDFRPVITT